MPKQLRKTKEEDRYQAQADAVRALAEVTPDGIVKSLVLDASKTVQALATRKKKENAPGFVLALPSSAEKSEVKKVRQRRSVKHGEDVYLPSWRDAAVGLPNSLVRSALFSAVNPGTSFVNEPIAAQGDVVLSMTGPQLGYYDRRVFAACLNQYREDRPLAGADGKWVQLSYWQFAKLLQGDYSATVHIAIRDSLIRLHAATLRVKIGRTDLPVPRLIEVAFDDGFNFADTKAEHLKGSDIISFRILDSMAMLFGPNDWSAVSECALHDYSGLAAWLVSFYSTHAEPRALEISKLHEQSASKCDNPEFRRRLRDALAKLQRPGTDDSIRVAAYKMTKDMLTVYLERWNTVDKKAASTEQSDSR